MTVDVFNDNQDDQSGNDANKAAPNLADVWVEKLVTITREDGTPKYETVEQALDALKVSQEHIARIERENAELAEKTKENETLQETIKRLSGNMNTEEKPAVVTPPANGGLSVEAAEELVKKVLDERNAVGTSVSNLKRVNDALIARFGSKAGEVAQAKAKQLGTTPEKLKALSAENPDLVLELFGTSQSSASPNLSSVNLDRRPMTQDTIERPAKSLLSGPAATDRNRIDHLAKIRTKVYKENGIT